MSFSVIQCPVKAGTENGPASIIEALARTMSARDGFTHEHARRVQRYAVALAGEACIQRPPDARGHRRRGVAARHRQARDSRSPAAQAGTADAPTNTTRSSSTPIIGADILSAVSLRRPARAHRAAPPRELGRHRLSRRPARRGDPARRARARHRRLLRRADVGSAVPPGAFARPRARDDSSSGAARCTTRRSRTRSCGSSTSCDGHRIGIAPAQRRARCASDRDGWRG